jgi:malate dehydrogenase
MDIAIVGATGSCGRQLAAQLLERRVLPPSARLQLVGHRGGRREHELWGLRADLEDAFEDEAPSIELALEPTEVDATSSSCWPARRSRRIPTSPPTAWHSDARTSASSRPTPTPSPAGMAHPRRSSCSPTPSSSEWPSLRRVSAVTASWVQARTRTRCASAEIAADLGIRRPQVAIPMLGQHGDHVVPAWSLLEVRGEDPARLA